MGLSTHDTYGQHLLYYFPFWFFLSLTPRKLKSGLAFSSATQSFEVKYQLQRLCDELVAFYYKGAKSALRMQIVIHLYVWAYFFFLYVCFVGRPMIECSECLTWIHLSCAKIRKSNVPDVFICQKCRDAKHTMRRSNRVRTQPKTKAMNNFKASSS